MSESTTFMFLAASAIATVVIAIFAVATWVTTRNQLRAQQAQVDAMLRQVELQRQMFQKTHRPWVLVAASRMEHKKAERHGDYVFEIRNFGGSPALLTRLAHRLLINGEESPMYGQEDIQSSLLPPGVDLSRDWLDRGRGLR